jgi:hypothetical protein
MDARSPGNNAIVATTTASAISAVRSTHRQPGDSSMPDGNLSSRTVPIRTIGGAHEPAVSAISAAPPGTPWARRSSPMLANGWIHA